MPTIMPVSDLQRNFKAVAVACAETKEPVYLTRNGYPTLVVMDAEAYEKEHDLRELIYKREMRALKGILRGHAQIQDGKATSLEEARALRAQR